MLTRFSLVCQLVAIKVISLLNFCFFTRSFNFKYLCSCVLNRQVKLKAISFLIVCSLLANTTPAAPSVIWSSVNNLGSEIRYAYLTSPTVAYLNDSFAGLSLTENVVFAFFFGGKKKQESVSRLEISPNGATIREGDQIYLTAAAFDGRGNLLQGVKVNWTAQSNRTKSPVLNLPNGRFDPQFFGDWTITAQAGGLSSQVVITVKRDDAAIFGKELRQQKIDNARGKKESGGTLRPTKINQNQSLPDPIEISSRSDNLATARQKNENSKAQKRNLPQPDGKEVVGLKVSCSPDNPYYPDCGYEEADQTKKVTPGQTNEEEGGGQVISKQASEEENQSVFQKTKYSLTNPNPVKTIADIIIDKANGKIDGKIDEKAIDKKSGQKSATTETAKSANSKKKGNNKTIDLKTMVDSNCPTGYTSVGIAMLGAPSAAAAGNRLFAFIRGTDNVIYWKYTEDGSNFSNWISLGGGTYENPRTKVTGNTVYLEVTGTDNNNYYQSTTNGGNNWSGWISGTVNAQTAAGAVFLGNTYTFVAGTGSQIPLCVQSNGGGCNVNGYNPTYGWNNLNYLTADDPGLQTGNPTGGDGTAGAGSGNFSFSAPVLSLGGRGDLGVGLSLNYNSLLWHKANGEMTYDIDKGFPAPGWSIGFGKLMDMGSSGGSMLEDPDGTRHSYDGILQNYYGGYSNYQGRTRDGSYIDYTSSRTPAGISSGTARFPNGMIITYGAASDGVAYPTQIKDRHGNYLNISYCNNVGPKINNITDDLNRTIQFNYSGNRLISVTGPGFNGASKTFVRIHYKTLDLTGTFTGLTVKARTATPDAIDAIYYPETNTGYWFGDEAPASSEPSYSVYGMMMKVSERRNMSWAANQTDPTSVGAITREMVYAYPMTPSNLTDAPKYSQMTEDWFGREPAETGAGHPATDKAITQYNIVSEPTAPAPRTTTITLPNGNRIIQYSKNDPNAADDGMLYKVESLPPTGSVPLGVSETDWELGHYNAYRVKEVRSTDEKGQMTKQTFAYTYFNLVTEAAEYGYKNTTTNIYPLLRKTVSSYDHIPDYSGTAINGWWSYGNHLFAIVKTKEVYDAATNVRLSKSGFNYDQYSLADTLNVVMYDQTYNPNTTVMTDGGCINWEYIDPYDPDQGMYCTQYEQVQNFNQTTLKRGNLTNTTAYSNAAPTTPTGAVTYTSTYDITGNTRTATTDCCEQMSFVYSTNTQYSQPDSHTKGGGSAPTQNTESATYDISTGLMTSSTDFNNLTTSYYYDAANRPTVTVGATQAKSETVYDDVNLKVTQTAYKYISANNYEIIGQSTSFSNGRGQVIKSESLADGQTNGVQVKYDQMGRKRYASMPFQVVNQSSTEANGRLIIMT